MRVATYYHNHDVRVEERPIPAIGPGELLVQVMASGICGSDVMEWYRIQKAPLVLGHEVTGLVKEVGRGVRDFKPGDRVCVSHHVPCGTCRYCLTGHETVCDTLRATNFDPGGFAEYIRVPAINVEKKGVFHLPKEVSYEDGTFAEPLGCALRAQRTARMGPGKSVLVLGAGISGLLHIILARSLGAGRILATDVSPYRLELARQFGADQVIQAGCPVPRVLRENNQGKGADLVIVCAGADTALMQSFECPDRGGTILFFAPARPGKLIGLPVWNVWKDDISLLCSYGAAPRDIRVALEMIRSGRVKVGRMITHRLGLSDACLGFGMVAKAAESLKVIIEPWKEKEAASHER